MSCVQAKKTRILVLSSCSASKVGPQPRSSWPGASELDNPTPREATIRRWSRHIRPAVELYTGQQHRLVTESLALMGDLGGTAVVQWWILSAGFGLVPSGAPLIPYNVTFSGQGVGIQRERGRFLGIPEQYLQLLEENDVVFHLLGKDYLVPLDLPPELPRGPVLVFIGGSSVNRLLPDQPNTVVVKAGQDLCPIYHAASVALKGAVFREIARNLRADHSALARLIAVPSSVESLARPPADS